MSSERFLTELTRNHLQLQGIPATKVEAVKRWDEMTGRVDLHLAVTMEEFEVVLHLVVELFKAPGITPRVQGAQSGRGLCERDPRQVGVRHR